MVRKTRLNRKRKSYRNKRNISKRISKISKARKMSRKRTNKRKKAPSGMPKIFVINLRRDPHKWEKYEGDYNKGKLTRYSACNGMEMSRANPY